MIIGRSGAVWTQKQRWNLLGDINKYGKDGHPGVEEIPDG